MSPFTRREALVGAGAALIAGAAAPTTGPANAASPTSAASTGFLHGVASGDPHPTSVLLWTRITAKAGDDPGSGRGASVTVTWEVASDAAFTRIVSRGTARTGPERDHTVKVVAPGLRPETLYWYRFRAHGMTSPTGRTKTAPAAASAVARLTMGVVSCSNWQAGYFSAYRHLAVRTDLDLVLHLGDYLYEYAPGEYQARDVVVRPHDPAKEMTVLADYRRRHAQYKTDRDLQALHASVPFVVTWDDHEFTNDAWSGGAENHTEGVEGTWTARRAASQQAYAEWMPVRYELGGRLYRDFAFGTLATIAMLDLRTYRSEQVASPAEASAIASPDRTITGAEQMDWLLDRLSAPTAQWKIVGNPVMISPVRFPSTVSTDRLEGVGEMIGGISGVPYNVDQWDGYTADRSKVVSHLEQNAIADTVFLTGDIHSGWACDIPADPLTYPVDGRSVATELVCTSVTSDNLDDILNVPPRTASLAVEAAFQAANPHVKYLDFDSHGFSVVDVTPGALRMDWYVLADRTSAASSATLSTSWQVAAGTQRVTRSTGIL